MKKGALILLSGLLVCTAAFSGFYYVGTARSRALLNQPQPELAWLKAEFNLSDAEFARISTLHEAYLPECARRCARIAEENRQIEQLLAHDPSVTPELRKLLDERAATRAECEAEMLNHFVAVSRTMPPDQGRRYLEWAEQHTVLSGQAMEQSHGPADSIPMPHHHSM